ncbi:glycoside hydrolase family 97 protein [Bacteroides ihuae]|uniref:glycoside hydrolase family 97 protein n=1 Tax=Bacteroides ihuae TaxID=1852362 RepID=UPI0008DB264B|nr:glycoside hydrolase family 97 protein [Bacteroides ihuae]
MKSKIITGLILLNSLAVFSQKVTVISPNHKINIGLYNTQSAEVGEWYLKVNYINKDKSCEAIPKIAMGLARTDQNFSKELKYLKASKPALITERYSALHGKRMQCSNLANETVISFENPGKAKLNLIIRAYNDGVAFRYEFPEKKGSFVIQDELTSYAIPDSTKRWMEKWNTANEGLYSTMNDDKVQQNWGYPALFNSADKDCWYLIHEADVNRNYCGSKLSNVADKAQYKITFPDQRDGNGQGESKPTITLPWKSPWRVIIMGSLADIVESTLVDDVCPPSVVTKTDWIKPGVASWNYWSSNHGTKDYKTVCEFADLAASMNWPYTLLDWEWDAMSNGGNLEDAIKYILSKGIKPLIWYNSGGPHTWVSATPRDRMYTHENRMEEFAKLKKLGIVGVKIDFFESEKQDMIKYYLDILDDAAKFEMMVYFHGCLVPRGWARTYPHMMTYEGVRGAEWYNNGPEFTTTAPEHNTILPFTRNVVGAMDYTPVTFTNSQFPHTTSYGHELALSVVFESGIQHMADRPSGYYGLPFAAKNFLMEVPNAWDNTKLIDGYPGKDLIIARNKGNEWYIGGISAEKYPKDKTITFNYLPEGVKYKLTLIADGEHDKELVTQYLVVDKSSIVKVRLLGRGGFAACLKAIQ